MSKKFKRAAKALAGIGAAYLGAKMLGNKGMDKIDMKAVYEDMPSPKSKSDIGTSVLPKAKPSSIGSRMPRSKNRFLGMNFGVSETPSNLEGFKEAERQRRIKTGFGRNVGRRSMATDAFDITGAKTGKFVTTKCKLGRNKKTKIT